tara:strand:- start:152 stop:574 length:423 start_codon:yes stop_codon:yes gene_type:complete
MKWLLLIGLFFIGCSSEPESDCGGCGLEVYALDLEEVSSGHYRMEYDTSLTQTYTTLGAITDCGISRRIQWDTNYKYRIQNDLVSLVNPASMTDEFGEGRIIFAAWEPFIDYTVTVYCGYIDLCGVEYLDSIKVTIVDEE